jgi:NTE family protein
MDARCPPPRIALALGGGAALGWAHIGVIQALEARGLVIEAVAGTSIGAVVAAAYCAGRLPALEALARSANRMLVLKFLDVSFNGGVLGGRVIERELKRYFLDHRLEDLPIPCATVAADLATGTPVVMRTGPIVEAVRASLSIPGIFPPLRRDGHVLADGGLINPVPVSAARLLSAAPVIAVNLQADYLGRAGAAGLDRDPAKPPPVVGVSRASIGLMLATLADLSLRLTPADAVIEPRIGHVDVADFTRADELIREGAAAVERVWPVIGAALQPAEAVTIS